MFDLLATLDELKTLGESRPAAGGFGSGEGADKARLRVANARGRDRGSATADRFAAAEGDALSRCQPTNRRKWTNYSDSKPSAAGPVTTPK